MDIKFSEMSVDTSLAQEYLIKNEGLLDLYNDYNSKIKKGSLYIYNGKVFKELSSDDEGYDMVEYSLESGRDPVQDTVNILQNLQASLKRNSNLIAQLEYHIRNIPIEDTEAQLNLIIQIIGCRLPQVDYYKTNLGNKLVLQFLPNDPLLVFGLLIERTVCGQYSLDCYINNKSNTTAILCHLFVSLICEAGVQDILLVFREQCTEITTDSCHISTEINVKGLDSGTLAVVSEDADVDSAVDKFLATSRQAPWRLRKILVQESVYQQFKEALRWKCDLKKSIGEPPSDVRCAETLTYNGRTFLIDPVENFKELPSVVSVESYRTIKEMLSLIQQDATRYLSLWSNGIAEINEVTHNTKAPVVWVNNVADFRGPPQVSEAVYSYVHDDCFTIRKCDKIVNLDKLSKSWQKQDVESRRDILCSVLDKYILRDSTNVLYTEIKKSLTEVAINAFVHVGKDFVCMGMLQPLGIIKISHNKNFFTVEKFKLLLQGNAVLVNGPSIDDVSDYEVLEKAGVPVVYVNNITLKYTQLPGVPNLIINHWHADTRTRVIWTNSGTMFAN